MNIAMPPVMPSFIQRKNSNRSRLDSISSQDSVKQEIMQNLGTKFNNQIFPFLTNQKNKDWIPSNLF